MAKVSSASAARMLAMTAIVSIPLIGQGQTKTGDVAIGARYVFHSAQLASADIPVSIHLPPDYDKGSARWPVLYMLDIADDFVFASATADFLAKCGRTPGLVVVSINVDKLSGSPQGMIGFLEKELLLYVDHNYRTTPQRLLYGHSGRSFAVLFIMLNRPELFDSYICPALGLTWPVEQGRLDLAAMAGERFDKMTSLSKTFVFSLGDEKQFYAGVDRFRSVLKTKAPAGLRWTYIHMPEDDHYSNKLKTLYQGLEFVFKAGSARSEVSGSWTGSADIRTGDGQTNKMALHANLNQDGQEITGFIGPSPDQQFRIAEGLIASETISFIAPMPVRVYRVRLKKKADGILEGEVSSADGKVKGTVVLERLK